MDEGDEARGGGRARSGDERSGHDAVTYLTFAAAAIGASWGLVEILLVIDPFRATWFKFFGWLGVLALVLAAPMAACVSRFREALLFGLATFGAAMAVGALLFGRAGDGRMLDWLSDFLVIDRVSQSRVAVYGLGVVDMGWVDAPIAAAVYGVLLCLVALMALSMSTRLSRTVTPPMVVALMLVSLFYSALSAGRSREIDARDIALEELRAAGMDYSLAGLQTALYFLDDRALKLYREAGFDAGDVREALTSPYQERLLQAPDVADPTLGLGVAAPNATDPLFDDVFNRALERIELGAAQNARVDRVLALFKQAFYQDPEDPDLGEIDATLDLGEPGAARPLLSHMLERGALRLSRALLAEGASLPYAADIPLRLEASAPLTRAEADAVVDAFGGMLLEDRARAMTAVDPLLPILGQGDAIGVGDSGVAGLTDSEIEDGPLCTILQQMAARGVRASLADDLASGWIGAGASIASLMRTDPTRFEDVCALDAFRPEREDPLADAPDPVRQFFGQGGFNGTLVRRLPGGACSIDGLDGAFDLEAVSAVRPGWTLGRHDADADVVTESTVYTAPILAELNDTHAIRGVAHVAYRGGEWRRRYVYGAASQPIGLNVTDWAGLDFGVARSPMVGPGQYFILDRGPDLVLAEGPRVRLGRSGAEAVTATVGPRSGASFEVSVQRDLQIIAAITPTTAELCAELRVGGPDGRLVASTVVPRTAAGAAGKDDEAADAAEGGDGADPVVRLFSEQFPSNGGVAHLRIAALAADAADVQVSFSAPERFDFSSTSEADALALELPTLSAGMTGAGDVSSEVGRRYAAFRVEDDAQITLEMDGLAADVDIELLRVVAGGALESLNSSTNASDSAEQIVQQLTAGSYLLRVYGYDGAASPFRVVLTGLDQAERDPLFLEAEDLGAVAFDAPRVVSSLLEETRHFRFAIADDGLTTLVLDGLTTDLELELYDRFGGVIELSTNAVTQPERITRALPPGEYRLSVTLAGVANIPPGGAPFQLAASVEPLWNTQATTLFDALNGPPAPVMATGLIGRNVITAEQFERYAVVEVAAPTQYTMTLTGLSADLDIELIPIVGGAPQAAIAFSYLGDSNPETLAGVLEPGLYAVRIFGFGSTSPFDVTVVDAQPADGG